MPSLAKAYITIIAAVATVVLMVVVARWNPENLGRFFLFFCAGDGGLLDEDSPAGL